MPEAIETFEGVDVTEAMMKITKAGDGLSAQLAMDPIIVHRGDKAYLVLQVTCAQVTYRPSKRFPGTLARVHTMETELASAVDGQAVAKVLADAKKIAKQHAALLEEERKTRQGVVKIPGTTIAEVEPTADERPEGATVSPIKRSRSKKPTS